MFITYYIPNNFNFTISNIYFKMLITYNVIFTILFTIYFLLSFKEVVSNSSFLLIDRYRALIKIETQIIVLVFYPTIGSNNFVECITLQLIKSISLKQTVSINRLLSFLE